jgi:protein-S-isoprenylcysteine O-methyltransferase Ste14
MSEASETEKLNRYGYNAIARQVFTAIASAVILFLAAGTTDWFAGWLFAVVYFLCWLALSIALAVTHPALLNERGKPTGKSLGAAKSWDKVILPIYSLLVLIQPLVAGLDKRFAWSADGGLWFYLTGNTLLIVSFWILAASMIANRHFEAVARIQSEKNHDVISSGIYHYVRHPGYLSVIISFLAIAIALSSWVAMLVGIFGAILFVIRTSLEDKMLQEDLPGYKEFAQETPYRLIPFVW